MATLTEVSTSGDPGGSLWDTAFFGFSVQHQEIANQMREILRTCPNPLGPYIANIPANRDDDNARPKAFTKTDVAAVESHLVKSLKKEDLLPVLRILKKSVVLLNKKRQESIPTPTRLDRLMADPNLIPKNLSEVQRRVAKWAEAETSWLNETSRFSTAGIGCWEMVVASAVFRGGLLSVKRAVAFARALAEPRQHFGCSEIRGYADLAVTSSGQDEEVVRWYPDRILLLLISRVPAKKVEEALALCSRHSASVKTRDRRIAQVVLDGVVAEFERQGIDPGLMPRSFSDFVSTIARNLRKDLPSLLLDYATGLVRSPSLAPGSIGRINNDPAVYVPPAPDTVGTAESDELPDRKVAYSKESKEPEWMDKLRVAFRSGDVDQTKRALSSILRFDGSTPSAKQLCTLSKKLLTGPPYGGSGRPWAYGSVRCCILTVARRFALQRKDEDPAKYTTATFEGLYKATIDEAAEDSRGVQSTVAWALRQYHRHLASPAYDAKNIDEGIALRVPPGSDSVDANVVSIDDIFNALDYIESSRNRLWKKLYRTAARGLIVLDFFGGLRRAEGLGLTPSDLLPGPFSEVFVRDNDSRTLKTENANRCVELGILAHPFSELLLPVRELFREAENLRGNISCGLSDDVIVPIVHEALREVTGLKTCHMHTLRHSAAHWNYLRLALADQDVSNLFPHLPKTTVWLKHSQELRSLLLHSDASVNDSAWVVAAIMGHSNPGRVTFRYYVHSADIVLAQILKARATAGSYARGDASTRVDELRGVSGLPRSTAYNRRPASRDLKQAQNFSASGGDLQFGAGWHQKPEDEFVLKLFSDRLRLPVHPISKPAPQQTNLRSWPKDTYDILWMSSELGLSEERLASIFGIDRHDISAMLARAKSVLQSRGYKMSTGSVAEKADVENFKVPRPPKVSWGSHSFRALSTGIENYCNVGKDTATILDYIVQHILPSTGQIVFAGNPRQTLARGCQRLFYAIGFRPNELQVISCDGTERAVPTRRWLQEWGISRRIPAINQFGPNRLLLTRYPWVVVGPRPAESSVQSPFRTDAKAIWFLIRMAAIHFSVRDVQR